MLALVPSEGGELVYGFFLEGAGMNLRGSEVFGSGCGVSSGIIPPSHGQFQAMIERSRTSGGDGSSSIRVAFQCGRRRRGQ